MPLKTTPPDETPTINLTSLIDIVFLVIVFFMLGTKFTEMERGMELRLPEVAAAGALSEAPVKRVVNVYQDGQVTLDRRAVTLEELTNRLSAARSQYKNIGVVVRGDAVSLWQHVAKVIHACHQAGVVNVATSVKIERLERK